jgi:hypothetical protein
MVPEFSGVDSGSPDVADTTGPAYRMEVSTTGLTQEAET